MNLHDTTAFTHPPAPTLDIALRSSNRSTVVSSDEARTAAKFRARSCWQERPQQSPRASMHRGRAPSPGGAAAAASSSFAAAAASSSAAAAPASSSARPLGVGALPFHAICTLFDKIERTRWEKRGAAAKCQSKRAGGGGVGRNDRCSKLLSAFFDHCAHLGGDPHGLLILLLPDADLDRRFDCKETTLVQLLLKGFGINKTRTGEALTNWRTGAAAAGAAAGSSAASSPLHPREGQGDLSLTILSLMSTYCSTAPTLSVGQVNGWLDRLAARSQWTTQSFKDGLAINLATLRNEEQTSSMLAAATAAAGGTLDDPASESGARLIFHLYSRCTSLESKWLTRILLRDLKLGLSARIFMDAFHPHLYAIWLRRGNLKEACNAVRMLMCAEHHAPAASPLTAAAATATSKPKRKRVDSFDPDADSLSDDEEVIDDSDPRSLLSRLMAPSLGQFIQVQLCSRAHSIPYAEAKLAGREVCVSEKFDGERVQIHVWRSQSFPGEPPLQQTLPDSTLEETWIAPDCPFSVRIFSRSARNSTLARSGCVPFLLASLGLTPLPSRYTPSPEPPAAAAASSAAAASALNVKREGEPFKMEDEPMMPPLETAPAFSAAGSSASAFYPPAAAAAAAAAPTVSPALPFVPSFAASSFRSCILDGELLVFNELSQTIEPFGGLGDLVPRGLPRAGMSGPGNRHRLVFEHRHHLLMLFDCMHLNGESLLNQPLKTRLEMLEETIAFPIPQYVQVAPHTIIKMPGERNGNQKASAAASASFPTASSAAAATAAAAPAAAAGVAAALVTLHSLYLTSLAAQQEGLVLKDAHSRYIPAHRGSWLKLKRDYIAGFGDTIDLCVVGAVWGMGKGGGVLSTFTLAAKRNDPTMGTELRPPPEAIGHGGVAGKGAAAAAAASVSDVDSLSNPLQFQVLFDVGIGLNSSELRHMHHLLLPLMRPYSARKDPCPPWLRLPKGYKVDMLLRDPTKAVVVEVLGSGFLGCILRFPRILRVKIGHGCDYRQALDLEQYLAIASRADRRLDGEERKALEQKMQESAHEHSERARETGRLPHPPTRESRFSHAHAQPAAAAAGPFLWLPPGGSCSTPQVKSDSKPVFFPSGLAVAARPAASVANAGPAAASAAPIDLTSSPIRPRPIPRRSAAATASTSASAACSAAVAATLPSARPARGNGVLDFAVSLFEESQSLFPSSMLQDEEGADGADSPTAVAAQSATELHEDSEPGTGDEMQDAEDGADADSYCSIYSSPSASLVTPTLLPRLEEASVKLEPELEPNESIPEKSTVVKEERKDSQSEAPLAELSSQPSLCLSFGSSHDSHEPSTPIKREPVAAAEHKSDGKSDRPAIDAEVSVKVESATSATVTPSKPRKIRPRKKHRSSRPLRPPPLLQSPPGIVSSPRSSPAFDGSSSSKALAPLQSEMHPPSHLPESAPVAACSPSLLMSPTPPSLCNPKKSWECRRSFVVEGASRRLNLGASAAEELAMSPAAPNLAGLCPCRRDVWLEADVTVDPIVRQFLEFAGFVLHTLPAGDEDASLPLPSIVVTNSADLAIMHNRLARRASAPSGACPSPSSWIVASAAFFGRIQEKLQLAGGVAKLDSRSSRKLLYSALAQSKIGDTLA